ncbi:MAG: zinc ribbon domain-containing protein [Chloroflexi bacterium]|nr:zinc ribbon domain-containing protein [Chloroflexota bacterium]
MDQIFFCPTCGAQNVIGQEFCQRCGQKFQYNCPFCGAIVDSTFINCPGCRESLYWPTPQKVKPFPKQPTMYQGRGEGGEEEAKSKKKSDPWLTGCLGLVILAFLVLGAYFVYDNFIKKPSPIIPLAPSSGEEIGFKPIQSPELEPLLDVRAVVCQEDETQGWL